MSPEEIAFDLGYIDPDQLVAAAERFGLPIHAIGVGESADDLRPFDPRAVARAIAGLPPE